MSNKQINHAESWYKEYSSIINIGYSIQNQQPSDILLMLRAVCPYMVFLFKRPEINEPYNGFESVYTYFTINPSCHYTFITLSGNKLGETKHIGIDTIEGCIFENPDDALLYKMTTNNEFLY